MTNNMFQLDIEKLKDLLPESKTRNQQIKDHLFLGVGVDLESWYTSKDRKPREQPVYLPDSVRAQHFGCFGTTGCGKSTMMSYMIENDIYHGRNVVVIDPKGDQDLFASVIQAAIKAGRAHELIYISPIYPDLSAKINMLHYYFIKDELVDHVVSGIKAREEYFINVAQEVTIAIIHGLDLLARVRNQPLDINFFELKKWCSFFNLGQLARDIQPLKHHSDPEIREEAQEIHVMLEQILSSPQDFFSKVSSSLRTVLTALSSSTTGKIIGKARSNEFIKRLEEGRGVILFCNTGVLLSRRTAHIIARVVVSMIQACLGRLYSTGRKFEPELCLYFDEGHNVLYYGIHELFNKGRSANVWINFFTQSFSQVEKEVGPEAALSIVDNISTWCYMRVNCEASAKIVENSVKEISKGRLLKSFEDGFFMPTLRDMNEKMITADKVLRLPNRLFYLKVPHPSGARWYIAKTPEVEKPSIRIIFPPIDVAVDLPEIDGVLVEDTPHNHDRDGVVERVEVVQTAEVT